MCVVFLLSAGVSLANAEGVARVDAERLVNGMSKTDGSAHALAERHYLAGYLAGVADAAEGKSWCADRKIKSGEIDSAVLGELRKMPRDALRENAAAWVERILKQKFPCRN